MFHIPPVRLLAAALAERYFRQTRKMKCYERFDLLNECCLGDSIVFSLRKSFRDPLPIMEIAETNVQLKYCSAEPPPSSECVMHDSLPQLRKFISVDVKVTFLVNEDQVLFPMTKLIRKLYFIGFAFV